MIAPIHVEPTQDSAMQTWHIATIVLCVIGIAAGQVLFKFVALGMQNTDTVLDSKVLVPFVAALALYAVVTLVWIWVLQFVPLSLAYPFMALSFVLVPVASWLLLAEQLGVRYIVGVLLIGAGVLLAMR